MKTPEEIKKALGCCSRPFSFDVCNGCPYDECGCGRHGKENFPLDVLTYINQLEEAVSLMKIQMHGDCGVCKHRTGFDMDMARMSMRCYECMAKESRPNWEYEGLPEVKSR